MPRRIFLALLFALLLSPLTSIKAQLPLPVEKPVRLARYPALSPEGRRICFTWQGNLWVASTTGGAATRLTAYDSYDSNPHWSPDGAWIAFNSDREGGSQIYLIPAVGGPARQITFHSAGATLCDWFPDGKSLLITDRRDTTYTSIYRLDVLTGHRKRLVSDEVNCFFPSLSADGKWIAFTRGALQDIIRKGYRGAANFDVYTAPTDLSAPPKRLTDSDRNDMWPLWGADNRTVYYVSEREGIATFWKQPRDGAKPIRVVSNPPDAIRYPSISRDGDLLAYECEGQICLSPTQGGKAVPIPLICRTDERGPRTNYATFTGTGVAEYTVSPDGKKMAFIVRGDIFVVTIDKGGDAKRLTDTPTREQDIAWSPDGKFLVYSSNRDGSSHLFSINVATREVKQLTQSRATDSAPAYSPDGKWIAFRRSPQTGIYLIRPDGTGEQQIVKGPKVYSFHWSPDNRWLLYSQEDAIRNLDVWVVGVTADGNAMKSGAPINISDYPGFNISPVWSGDGSKIVFRSNRTRNRDVETINDAGRFAIYTVPLTKEKVKFEEDEDTPKPAETKPPDLKAAVPKIEVKIDPDEIERRAKRIVAMEEGVSAVSVSPDGKTVVFVARSMGQSDIWQVGIDGGSTQRLTSSGEAPGDFEWAPDSSRFYYVSNGGIHWLGRGGAGAGSVSFTVRMEIDRTVDYRAVFDEAWQVLNENYYDQKFHGVDWKAVGQKYRSMIDDVRVRQDFNYLITEMLGELNSSHTGYFGGGSGPARGRETGYLGIFSDENYIGPGVKIASVLPRTPAEHEESRLQPGEYILAIDGQEVQADASCDKALTDKVGRTLTLLVNTKPVKAGARTVKIKLITGGEWQNLLYEKWLDDRRAIVAKTSAGRFGYLHVPDMGDAARNRFERELFSQLGRKEGMILDLRNNNGGDTHDSLLRILERNRTYFTFAPRTETPFPQPERAIVKPIILLINEHALSDAEVFTNGFRHLGLGKVVGTPTMGWIIFTTGRSLMDGSFIRVPYMGCFTLDGRDMENWGVPPDIMVENMPADFLAGRDPQLERAVQELLKDHRLVHK